MSLGSAWPYRRSPLDHALVLSLVAVVGTVLWFLLVANVVGALRRLFARPAVRKAVDGLTGTVLIALGVNLAVAGRS